VGFLFDEEQFTSFVHRDLRRERLNCFDANPSFASIASNAFPALRGAALIRGRGDLRIDPTVLKTVLGIADFLSVIRDPHLTARARSAADRNRFSRQSDNRTSCYPPRALQSRLLSAVRWIVGDIHGMIRPLEALVRAVKLRDSDARLIFVGDYVNRGPDSKRVVDFLLSLNRAQFIRGNHDDVFDHVVNGVCFEVHPDMVTPAATFLTFLQFGLDHTLTSYGVDLIDIAETARKPSERNLRELTAPISPRHRQFFRGLPAVIDEPDLFVAHAKWDVDEPAEESDFMSALATDPRHRHAIMWGRFTDAEIRRKKRWRRRGFFGHTPVSIYATHRGEHVPIVGPGIVLLDTAAALSVAGRLSAYCAEDDRIIQSDRFGEIIEHPPQARPQQ